MLLLYYHALVYKGLDKFPRLFGANIGQSCRRWVNPTLVFCNYWSAELIATVLAWSHGSAELIATVLAWSHGSAELIATVLAWSHGSAELIATVLAWSHGSELPASRIATLIVLA